MNEQQKEEIKNDFYGMKDYRLAFFSYVKNVPNPDAWLVELLERSYSEARQIMDELMLKDSEVTSSSDYKKTEWVQEIRQELKNNNITTDGLIEALVRKEFLNDPSLIEALKPKIQDINNRKPRP